MANARWQLVDRLYHEAEALAPNERSAFLAEQCADDLALQHEVESLLAHRSDAPQARNAPIAAVAADALPERATLTGQRLGSYEIGSLLGAGGMGEVYRARDPRMGRDVAVKVLAPAQGQAVRSAVEKVILEGAPFAGGTTDVRTALEQLKLTGTNPGAIAPYSEAVVKESAEKIRVVPGTVIRRPLGFVTIGAPSPAAKKMIDFFRSAEGKRTIK